MKSKILQLNLSDLLKGLLVAVLAPVFATLQQSLEVGELSFNYPLMATTAIAGGLGYLMKNLLSNNSGEFLTRNKS